MLAKSEKTGAEGLAVTEGSSLEIGEIVHILRERYRIILAITLAGLLLGFLLSRMTTPLYRASALLQYDPNATDSLEQTRSQYFKPMVANEEVLATQIGLLRSDALSMRVAQDLNLPAMPDWGGTDGTYQQRLERAAGRVRGSTNASVIKTSLLLQLDYVDRDPATAQKVAAAVAQAFIATSIERRYNASSYARRFLSEQLDKTKGALERSERAVNDYAIQAHLFRTPGQVIDGKASEGVTLSVTDLAAMEDALNHARVQRVAAEGAWKNGLPGDKADVSGLPPLLQQRAQLQVQYSQNAKIYKPDYPSMIELKGQIAQLDQEIDRQQSRSTATNSSSLLAAYRSALDAETALAARVATAKGQVEAERSRSVQYNILQREADTNRSQYDALLQRYKDVTVNGGIGQSNIALVDSPRLPHAPYKPDTFLNCLVGAVLGLLAGIATAFAIHLLFDTIALPADVRQKLDLRVLGAVPRDTEKRALRDALSDASSGVSEAYFSILTSLRFARAPGLLRCLFITSCHPGEGKSTTAYALAVASARLGRRVLLIDADLRRPTFGVAPGERCGLSDLLSTDDGLAGHIGETAIPSLHLLPAGSPTESAAELLSSTRLAAIVTDARAAYDLVIIDGPPVLGLTDAPLLGSVADGTVIVLESRRIRSASARDMVRRMADAGADILGAVLTKLPPSDAVYGYGYGYGYGAEQSSPRRRLGSTARFDPGFSLRSD